jgi:translation initiation factor IF-1
MQKNELILLDARITEMINNHAFRAVLGNGHALVAYLPGQGKVAEIALRVGDTVRVRMSPYDMSRGEIRPDGETETL